MLINERVFLFKKDDKKFKQWEKEIEDWGKKSKLLIEKSAVILGIKEEELTDKVWVSTSGELLINNKIAEKYDLNNKITVLGSDDMAIRNEKREYLGQWSTIKRNNKLYKEIENLKKEIEFEQECPDIRVHFLNNSPLRRIRCRRIFLEEYGVFFIIEKSYLDDEELKKALKETEEWKLSEFYKLLEKLELDDKE
jgi:hypothetical protein